MKRLTSFILHNPAVTTSLHTLLRCVIVALLTFSPVALRAAYSNHPTSIVENIATRWRYNATYDISNISDPSDAKIYFSGILSSVTDPANFTFTLKNGGISAEDSGDILFYIRRPPLTNNDDIDNAQPVEFEVKGLYYKADGKLYVTSNPLFNLEFHYRGPLTDEYSTRMSIQSIFDKNPSYKTTKFVSLRLVPVKNYNDEIYENRNNKFRDVAFKSIDILKIDYNINFEDFSFKYTRGIKDSSNQISGWEEPSDDEKSKLKNEFNITLPDFTFLPTDNDNIRNPYGIMPGQERQATHTTEHIIYAMPGDVIQLYPYYGLTGTPNFKENFSHWYDFKTGGIPEILTSDGSTIELLDFLSSSPGIQKTANYGYLGGKYMNTGEKISVTTVQEYIDAVNYVNNNGDHNAYISIEADLDFTGYNDIPMIGYDYYHRFRGTLNGNGHKISNLIINKPNDECVGIIARCTDYASVMNLFIDKTCKIVGKRYVGPIGYLANKCLAVCNLHSEATIEATGGQASGILGWAQGNDTFVNIEDCYVGGVVGRSGQSENAAIIGWLETNGNSNKSILKNIIVNCSLYGSDGNSNRKYVRSSQSGNDIIINGDGSKQRGIFKFDNCHGILDKNDQTWIHIPINSHIEFPAEELAKLGWTDYKTPPMSQTVDGVASSSFIKITDEADYIVKITEYNKGNTLAQNFELTKDLDFKDYGADDVPMIGDFSGVGGGKEFAGVFNGAGHTIKNLKISRDMDMVGMFRATQQNARIENLIIDSSCVFEGNARVGLIGYHNWNSLVIRNVKTEATVRGSGANTGGIVGISNHTWSTNVLTLENVYIGGVVGYPDKGWDNGAISGWLEKSSGNVTLTNVVVDCELYKGDGSSGKKYIRHDGSTVGSWTGNKYAVAVNDNWNFIYTNCFGNLDPTDEPWQTMPVVEEEPDLPEINNWNGQYPPMTLSTADVTSLFRGLGDRTIGTVATFYYPKDQLTESDNQSLPVPAGDSEYVVAADFSQTFNPIKNINIENKQILEPIIAFRHIFRIRDGRQLAEEMSGSVDNNKEYLRQHRKYVSARAGVPFQIRLDNPAPVNKNTKSNYYYKKSDGGYDRVYSFDIRVTDMILKIKYSSSIKLGFEFSEIFTGQNVDGTIGGDGYYRMLKKDNPLQGRWKIQIVGRDRDGNDIKIYNSNEPLVLMEYEIEFLPTAGASMITEKQLYDENDEFAHARASNMETLFGKPTTYIDFDEYININKSNDENLKKKLISNQGYNYDIGASPREFTTQVTPNGMEKTLFKWPVPWNQSTYSFGYDNRQDYSMYMLATHSDNVPYKVAASNWSANMPDDGKGLYDRSYYDSMRKNKMESQTRAASSDEVKQGYFYYVNAATDPGVSARLNINELCQGSTIYVSAWISEFSKTSETANLSFNFVAVMKDVSNQSSSGSNIKKGDRLVLHQFITGYVPYNFTQIDTVKNKDGTLNISRYHYSNNGKLSSDTSNEYDYRGQWLNVYYSFVPRLAEFSDNGITSDMVDHYELELDNNAKNSNGADYAIDDIRAYVVPPTVEAQQLTPACKDERMRMLLGSPFETLLEVAGKRESIGGESEKLDVYYTYLDKELFDNLYYQEKKSMEEAFNASIITYNYNISEEDDRTFGKITFNGNYSENKVYHEDDEDIEFGKAYSLTKESGQRMIVFESEISSGKLLANKHYYVIFKSSLGENDVPTVGQEATFFNMSDPCANTCVTYIKPPIITKINGTIVADVENIRICENQSPVIQVNLTGIDDDNEPFDIDKNVYFDWFYGSKEELDRYTDGNDDHTLFRALTAFRLRHEEEVMLDTITADDNMIEGEKFEQWMLDLIKKASKPDGNSSIAKLSLYLSSFVMPPARMNEDGTPFTHYVTVLPIACVPLGTYHGDSTKLVCSTPTPIPITVDARSPLLRHGLSGLTYPNDLSDVPLRIGIDQLKANLTGGAPTSRRIDLPVRLTLSSDSTSKFLKLIKERAHKFNQNDEVITAEEEGAVVLVQTNDPEYKDLGTLDKDSIEIGTLFWVGEIKKIVAKTNQNETKQYVQLEFDNSFNFKEGYMYKFRFQYEEIGESPNDTVCSGQDVFTIKVVPKYLAWTGAENINWNNDANWRRVGEADLLMVDMKANAMAHYVTNGYRGSDEAVNPNVMAYAPLDFTNVIVESGMEAPFMYPMSETKDVGDEYQQSATVKYKWPSNPEKGSLTLQDDDPGAENFGKVTPLIHYDMAAFEFDDNNRREQAHIGCRPWYANTCNEIHFKPGGTIMNQQELIYKKAWVDMELDHSRWYTVSSPLQNVYAGDFYLPSDGARQTTELYQDITFDNGLKKNNRFKPAVFQRGWDKSYANVYELDASKNEIEAPRNVAVKTFWSHVYNDVKEEYGGGVGFSIKTDISAMTSNNPGDSGKVLFRLPKADTEYLYWNQDGSKSGHKTKIDKDDDHHHHRLNDSQGTLTVASAEKCEYFLVGNPFMTHMDIKKFLDTNKDQLEQKYWVITKSGQIAGEIDGDKFIAADPTDEEWAEDPTVIAPMQGFFVKSEKSTTSLSLKYDVSMMRRYDSRSDHSGEHLTDTTRSASNGMLRIVAENYGKPSSAALLGVNYGSNWNVEAIDNRDIDIPSIVYTVGNGIALSINSVKEAEGTEIGVIADDDMETILRFESVDCIDGLYLLDKAEHSLTPIEEGMEVAVEGTAAGRFFLTYGIAEEGVMSGIEWSVSGGVLTAVDNANSGILEVNVYDTMGRLMKRAASIDNVINVSLESGIYVVEISTAKERETAKIKIGK